MRGRRTRNASETLIDFLVRELPPSRRDDAEHFGRAIGLAGERYDRYDERRVDWERYRSRRIRLGKLQKLAGDLALALCSLDLLSRDDLESRIGCEKIDYLNGLLLLVNQHAGALESETQMRGKPTDHATERWIFELANIYENAFSRPANVSGEGISGNDPADVKDPFGRRGRFYRLLQLGRPSRFPQHGRLSPKHVQTLLSLKAKSMSADDMGRLHQEIARGAKTRLTRMKS
jgi:hypothetical protein